jgi:hypothetical protein
VCGGRSSSKLGKCHFMVKQGIMFRQVISERGIEVDKAKVETEGPIRRPERGGGVNGSL